MRSLSWAALVALGFVMGVGVDRLWWREGQRVPLASPSRPTSDREPTAVSVAAPAPIVPDSPAAPSAPRGQPEASESPASGQSPHREMRPSALVSLAALERLEEPADIDRFLGAIRPDNLFDAVRTARPFDRMEERLGQLNGRFVGEVKLFAEPGKAWEMTLEAALRIDNRKLKGQTKILLADQGKVFSTLSGNGDLKEYHSLSDGIGILVKASPETYFQLYYLGGQDAFIGNYYYQESPDRILPKGTVRLDRG